MTDTLSHNDSVQIVIDSLQAVQLEKVAEVSTTVIPAIISQNYPLAISSGVVGVAAIIFGWLKIKKAKKGKK